jgi:inorganic phosphate transporter, PiT family
MDAIFDGSMTVSSLILLFGALALALGFEFVNGFHDTANAVATVIYTKSLKPTIAVIWSGTFNFLGVLTSSGLVAFGIIALLPVELILDVGSGPGFAMVFSLLLSAIIWNLGTWYLGLPASSSHTLIGSIVGVGLMNSYLSDRPFGDGVNWGKVHDTAMALMISPVTGFFLAALVVLVAKALIADKRLFTAPEEGKTPPFWIRGLLIFTCTAVSFSHGSNDGQKGMGLIMLVLIGIVPAGFAVNLATESQDVAYIQQNALQAERIFTKMAGEQTVQLADVKYTLSSFLRSGKSDTMVYAAAAAEAGVLSRHLEGIASFDKLAGDDRRLLRTEAYLMTETINKLNKAHKLEDGEDKTTLEGLSKKLKGVTSFIPNWVKVVVALALGLGTMIGWKRIVVTVGEKIGKAHLTYGQGAAAELVAATCIAAADNFGLPVSTTHILSSGIAGTMAANRSGLQKDTLRNILLAWVLTLPICVLLGASLFGASLYFVLNFLT